MSMESLNWSFKAYPFLRTATDMLQDKVTATASSNKQDESIHQVKNFVEILVNGRS